MPVSSLGLVNQVSIANPVYHASGQEGIPGHTFRTPGKHDIITDLLDYGLRYDYLDLPEGDGDGREPFFSPTTPNTALGGIPGGGGVRWFRPGTLQL